MDENENDVVYKVAKRAGELGEMKMDNLRSIAGYGCATAAEAIRLHRYETRGSLIELILVEEFINDENPRLLEVR